MRNWKIDTCIIERLHLHRLLPKCQTAKFCSCCREAADIADKAVKEAGVVADAARADEMAAKQELLDLREQLTEQLAASSTLVSSQSETIQDLYAQLQVRHAHPQL